MLWLSENQEWVFSGVGGVVVLFVLTKIFQKRSASQSIKGHNNIQVGGNIEQVKNDKADS